MLMYRTIPVRRTYARGINACVDPNFSQVYACAYAYAVAYLLLRPYRLMKTSFKYAFQYT